VETTLIDRLAVLPAVGTDYRGYDVSPDGSMLAFQWYRDGDWQVFLKELPNGEPRRVGDLSDACCCPRFSRDGKSLYFACDDRGSECFDIWRVDLATGACENLLPDTPDLSPLPDFDVSPDGATIAMSAFDGSAYHVAVMPAAPSPEARDVRFLTRNEYMESSPSWSPDGRRLAFGAATEGQDTAAFLLHLEDGALRVVGGSPRFFAGPPRWSPDGRMLAFAGGPFEHPAIGIYDVAGGVVSWVWQTERDAHAPAWSPDGRSLTFLADHDAETGLFWIDLTSGELREVSIGPGNHYQPSFHPDGTSLFCLLSAPDHPADLYRIDLADGSHTRLTESVPEDLRDFPFKSGRHVHFTSWDHLAEVPGLLVEPEKPTGAGVVIIHGGPTWHHANEWDALRQAFVAAGVTVLHPNYRGSDGYGRRWQLANRWLMGQGEALDCVAAHDELVRQGCDPRRIAVTGRSWGGFLTMAMLTQFPDLWACGVAGVPFFDFIDAQLDPDIREDLRWWDRQNTGDIEKDRAKLEYYSPINHLDRVQAPLLMLGGALDPRCPPRQIGEVAEKLRARSIECEFFIYPDEGHEISGMEHRVDYDRRTVDFILRHVGVAAE